MTTTRTDIFTGDYTDRHLTELASDVRRRQYFTTYVFESPSGVVWLTITFEHSTGSWVAELTNSVDDTHARAGRGDHMEWSIAQDIAERFIEP